MVTDTEFFNEIKSFHVMPNLGISDHNCLCASISTNFWTPIEETKVRVNNTDHIHYINPKNFLLMVESPSIKQEFADWIDANKNNNAIDY